MQITPGGGLWRALRKLSDLGLPMMKPIPALCGLLLVCVTAAPCVADVSGMYTRAELEKSAPRLSTALTKIYELGVKPYLTPEIQAFRLRPCLFRSASDTSPANPRCALARAGAAGCGEFAQPLCDIATAELPHWT